MRRMLLVSTAVLGLASLPALAQQTEPVPPAVTDPGAAAPAEAPAAATAGAPAPKPIPEQAEHQVRAQSLLGVDVSNGQDTIGKVSDLVVTDDGRVDAIVVGVGGFLGIGEKRVALAWDSIKLTEQDGGRVILGFGHPGAARGHADVQNPRGQAGGGRCGRRAAAAATAAAGWRAKPGRSAAGARSSSGAEQPVSTPAARLGAWSRAAAGGSLPASSQTLFA